LLHPFQVQRLKAQHIKLVSEPMRSFPKSITSTVGNVFMLANQVEAGLLSMMRTFCLPRKLLTGLFDSFKGLLEKQRRFNSEPFRASHTSSRLKT
jgi:hypothetical protein